MKHFKTFQNISKLILIAVLLSCSKDDETTPVIEATPDNEVVFDGTTYTMVDGWVVDLGASNPLNNMNESLTEDNTHYSVAFVIVDAALEIFVDSQHDLSDSIWIAGNSATIGIGAVLYSPGISSFQTGTFTYIDGTATEADIADRFVLASSEGNVQLDNNGVDEEGTFDGPKFAITGGSITVTGSGIADYTITYDVTVSGGKKLTGTYSGPFKKVR